ncbi:hypothetical protein HC928_02600 [bacterium]|nr:hypothetical protein [bacterium]
MKKKAITASKKRVNGRKKGANAERRLAKLFSDWWGTEFARTPLSGGFSTKTFREDWNAAGDLVTPDPAFPFCVESKKVEGWKMEHLLTQKNSLLHDWWNQTLKETPEGKIPLLVFTKNRTPLFAMMPWRSGKFKQCMPYFEYSFEDNEALNNPNNEVVIFELKYLLATDKKVWL